MDEVELVRPGPGGGGGTNVGGLGPSGRSVDNSRVFCSFFLSFSLFVFA